MAMYMWKNNIKNDLVEKPGLPYVLTHTNNKKPKDPSIYKIENDVINNCSAFVEYMT
jgi:hypothetical protein